MKLKSLLIGSAAVLAASSAARAADAIIVEPEPVEYVRVCDMYGTGFFYIPGTETCINFNGYVRSTYATGHAERDVKETTFGRAYTFSKGAWSVYTPIYGYTTTSLVQVGQWYTFPFGFPVPVWDTVTNSVAGLTRPVDSKSDWHSWTYRARFNIDVRNETEYGTLRSEIRFQAGDTNTQDGNVGVDRALISLAGFRLGYSDTYWTTNHGYGAGSPAINDGFINYDQAIFFDYTWSSDNLAVTVGVQDSSSGGSFAGTANGYADFYAGVNWKSDWGTFAFTALHDSQAASLDYHDGFFTDYLHWQREDAWVFKASAIIPLGDSGWELGGWYAWSENPYTRYITAYGLPNPGLDNEWGVQVNGKLTDNLSAYALYTAASGEAEVTAYNIFGNKYGSGSISDNSSEMWVVGAVWTPVNQLSVQVEYSSRTATSKTKNTLYGNAKITDTEDGIAVRVTRSF